MTYPVYSRVVESRVKGRVASEGIILKKLAEVRHRKRWFYKKLGFNIPRSALDRLSAINRGLVYGSSSLRTAKDPKNVIILSHVLYSMGFSEDDEAIAEMRRNDERFAYPPENGIPYEKIRGKITSEKHTGSISRRGPVYSKRATFSAT
jgi:hypothetical protein